MTIEATAARWPQIDPAPLRALLDTLRTSLASPSQPVELSGPDLIAIQLKEILDRLRDLDVEAQYRAVLTEGVLSGSAESRRLSSTLNTLHESLVKRVDAALGRRKLEVLVELLAEPLPSLLDVVDQTDSENAHSAVLAWLLTPTTAPQIAPAALTRLTSLLKDDPPHRHPEWPKWPDLVEGAIHQECLSVRREFVVGREWTGGDELDRVDLVISGPDFVIAIENKIWSPEHGDQTTRYWRWLASLPCRHAGVFLTPSGRFPGAPEFHALSYLDLLSCLLEAPSRGTITREERIVLAAYGKTLQRSVLRNELRTLASSRGQS